jgi:hypothetical protein
VGAFTFSFSFFDVVQRVLVGCPLNGVARGATCISVVAVALQNAQGNALITTLLPPSHINRIKKTTST